MSTGLPENHRVILGGEWGGTPRKVGWGVQPIFQHPYLIMTEIFDIPNPIHVTQP